MNQSSDHHDAGAGRPWALIALIVGALAIAFAPIFAKLASSDSELGTSASAFWRVALAVPVLFVIDRVIGWREARLTKSIPSTEQPSETHRAASMHLLWLAVPGVLFAGDLATWHHALSLTTAAHSTLLANLQAVIVGFISWFFLREKLKPVFALGTALALVGTAWLLFAKGAAIETAKNPAMGNMLSIVTAGFYASYILSIKRARRAFPTLRVMIGSSSACAVVLCVITLATGERFMPDTTLAWWSVVGLALVPHCLGQGLIAFALAQLPASFSAVTLLIQPVAAGAWAWLFLGEDLAPPQIAAGAIVVLGIYLARRGSP